MMQRANSSTSRHVRGMKGAAPLCVALYLVAPLILFKPRVTKKHVVAFNSISSSPTRITRMRGRNCHSSALQQLCLQHPSRSATEVFSNKNGTALASTTIPNTTNDSSNKIITTATTTTTTTTTAESASPLSQTIEELSVTLRGKGRALAVWDCLRVGIDPLRYYDPSVPDSELDRAVTDIIDSRARTFPTSTTTAVTPPPTTTTRQQISRYLPRKRQTEGLGKASLDILRSRFFRNDYKGGLEDNIATLTRIDQSRDGTAKLLVKFRKDGLEVETVIIPWEERGRSTLCLSSQVGCRQGCTFCATGRMGKLRSLTADEILIQVYYSRKVCRILSIPSVDNVVFMGMGEPADNAGAVKRACQILTDRQLFQMAQSRVTVSTVGPSPDSFGALSTAPAVLAWSVHATRDELRKKLVPTTRYTMSELRGGFVRALRSRPRKLRTCMLEVTLIGRVNDSVDHASHLAEFARHMMEEVEGMKLVVNLIPFNDIGHPTYRKPRLERIRDFQNCLLEREVMCYVRTTRGDDESAACGQLATRKRKEEEVVGGEVNMISD